MTKIALCQLNPTTGDFRGNRDLAKQAIKNNDADIYVFPECFVTNYTCDDLFNDHDFQREVTNAYIWYGDLSREFQKTIIVGSPTGNVNSAFVFENGRLAGTSDKVSLPNYSVFDDKRWFVPGKQNIVTANGLRIALPICEDLWEQQLPEGEYDIIIAINSSPYGIQKAPLRQHLVARTFTNFNKPIVYVNQVGGNDEIVWDGGSMATDGEKFFFTPEWQAGVFVTEFDENLKLVTETPPNSVYNLDFAAERYTAVALGLRDYVVKNGFDKIVFGNSGGADSCLVALLTADVFGPENCLHVRMPSKYTSDESNDLGNGLTEGLGALGCSIPIRDQLDATMGAIAGALGELEPFGLPVENLQAQLRGDILSFISNRDHRMIISTGNKSEAAMGYATLYGDMRGGFNPLKDLYKFKDVFQLLEWRLSVADETLDWFEPIFGKKKAAMAESAKAAVRAIIDRPPSAELAPGQKDTDSLPDYAILDEILWQFIDAKVSNGVEYIASITGQPIDLVVNVLNRVRRAEFKRNQACPGVKIHRVAFVKKDWRYPITNKFKYTNYNRVD